MEKTNITIDDLYKIKFMGTISVKKDGSRFIYTVDMAKREKNKYVTDVFEFNIFNGRKKRILKKGYKYGAVRYSKRGKWVSFISDRDHKEELYLMPSDGGEAESIKLDEYFINDYRWSFDDEYLLLSLIKKSAEEKKLENEKDERRKKALPVVRIVNRLIYKFDGRGFLHKNYPQLYLYDIKNKHLRKLTNERGGVSEGVFSPDGKKIYYTVFDKKDWELESNYISVCEMNLESQAVRKLKIPNGPKFSLTVSYDGKYLCYLGHEDVDDYTGTTNIKPYVYNMKSGENVCVLKKNDLMCTDTTIDDMGEGFESGSIKVSQDNILYFQVSDRGNTHLYKYEIDRGITRKVYDGEGKIVSFDAGMEDVVYSLSEYNHPGKIILFKDGKGERIVDPNKSFVKSKNISVPEKFTWKGFGGEKIDGWLLKPPDFDKRKTYPLVVEIHGGPHAQYGNSFFHEFQVLAAKGYIVFYSNPHGSTGYGERFAKSLIKRWGEPDSVDILNAVEILKSKSYIKEDRIGVTGGSYGGFMTNWLLGHTNVFRAAVTQRSISNLISFFGSSDFGFQFRKEFGVTFWDDTKYYLEHSPISYVKKIETPLLIIHSENDYRCPVEQAEQLFVALKLLKKKVQFARFPGESHGLSRIGTPTRRVKRLELMTDWFEKYV